MKLTDQSLMPFGKYAGKRMEDIPADYLLWIWEEARLFEEQQPTVIKQLVHDYIADPSTFRALETDARDVIVQHYPKGAQR